MATKTERYYQRHLQKYFDKHYIEYDETVECFVDPAINKWRFIVPELGIEVNLTCDDTGRVSEKKEMIK